MEARILRFRHMRVCCNASKRVFQTFSASWILAIRSFFSNNMKYYILKVTTSKPDVVPDYYVVNNQYMGYVGFDSQFLRSLLENNAKIKNTYQVFASGEAEEKGSLHEAFCHDARFSKKEAEKLVKEYSLKKCLDKTRYQVYCPNRNSSKSVLREIRKVKENPLITLE
jgi:hypothetical protein